MNFKSFLHNSASEISLELESFFQDWSKDVEQISPRFKPYSEALRDACRGGKRIRGALVKLGFKLANDEWKMENGKWKMEINKIAAAYEIFQAAILAHDDIIDKSELRRGEASLYTRLGGDHLGISKAICIGDVGFFLSFKIISESNFPDIEKNKALVVFSNAMLDTGWGELLDVELSGHHAESGFAGQGGSVRLDDILAVYIYKTAHYTFTAPLLLGAVLGGAKKSVAEPIKLFGHNIGIAFQIQDDINDIFKEKEGLGKDPGGDIKEGKQTLLYLNVLKIGSEKQIEILKKYYGNPNIGRNEIELVKDILQKSGALEFAQKEAERYAKKAKVYIPDITGNKNFQEILLEMTEYFVGK